MNVIFLSQAAKYYNDAAERGHADAVYNLGVLHAQGRGGFTIDTDKARGYFIKAAKLGQRQAQHALDLEKRYRQSIQKESGTILLDERKSILKCIRNNKSMNHILKKLTNYNNTLYTQSQVEFLENSDHKRTAVACPTPTQLLLGIVGLNKPNIFPLSMESNNCSVPY